MMTHLFSQQSTLLMRLTEDWRPFWRVFAALCLGNLLLIASAKLQVPFYPVPVSMQTLAIVLIGVAAGPVIGTACILTYLAQGAFGLPVFAGTPAKGLGLAYMAGPTGGYLVGFVLAGFWYGLAAGRGWMHGFWQSTIHIIIGFALIYLPGLVWLGVLFGWDKPILAWGLYPFLWGDGLKVLLGVACVRLILPKA
ncbi:MAG: biotin transporter BioY [Pseudomonadota bacterium]